MHLVVAKDAGKDWSFERGDALGSGWVAMNGTTILTESSTWASVLQDVREEFQSTNDFVPWNGGAINFSNIQRPSPPRWMGTTRWMPLTVEDLDRVR